MTDAIEARITEFGAHLARGDYTNDRILAEGLGLRIDKHED